MVPADTPFTLRRSGGVDSGLVVLGRSAYVAGRVRGDVLVVGGDLYLRPGARISGRAVAIGGAVYNSTLALAPERESHRDFTYDVTPVQGGFALDYREIVAHTPTPPVTLNGLFGFGLPTYDRSNGLSLPFSPVASVAGDRVQFEPRVTYRSNLGKFDPSADLAVALSRSDRLHAWAGVGTFSNDAWIWSDPVNSVETLVLGHDARDYFRARRGEISLSHAFEGVAATLEPYVGARYEHAWSVGPWPSSIGSPWALRGRHDIDDMLRPNVPVGVVASTLSLLAGATLGGSAADIKYSARLDLARGTASDVTCVASSGPSCPLPAFRQATFDGRVTFATFGSQSLRVDGHAVLSAGDTPTQRYAFLGGSGTIPTIHLLSEGGDQLVFVDSRYSIPVPVVTLPLLGAPTVVIRHVIGGAGVHKLPALDQAIGGRLYLSLVYAELMVDPANRHMHAGVGLSLGR